MEANHENNKLIRAKFIEEGSEPEAHDFQVALEDEKKIEIIADRFADIMQVLGLDLQDESLAKTPYRVAKMYVNEIFSGLKEETFPEISFTNNEYYKKTASNTLLMKVHFTSFCEHHFVPMMGSAFVAYIPGEKLIGLSKIPRIVKFFAKRPQIQERLTSQIVDSLSTLLETDDVAVSITAQHFCVLARGIEDQNGLTTTNDLRGRFKDDEMLRQEFFLFANKG